MILFSFLVLLLIALFPLGELIRFSFFSLPAVHSSDFVLLLVGALFIFLSLLHKQNPSRPLFYFQLLFIGAAIVSLVGNFFAFSFIALLIGSLYLWRFVAYALLVHIVSSSLFLYKRLLPLLLLGIGTCMTIAGYMQYFYVPYLGNMQDNGWDAHLYRLTGTFLDPNFMGAFLICFLLFLTTVIFPLTYTKKNIVFLSIFLFTLLALALTYSRSSYIMFFISFIVFAVLCKKKMFVGCMFIVFCMIVSLLFFGRHSEGTNLMRKTSSFARVTSAQRALIIFSRHPIFGVGFDMYQFAQQKEKFLPSKTDPGINHSASGTDTSILFLLATTGVIGTGAYITMYLYLITSSWKKRKTSIYAMPLVCMLIGLSVHSIFVNSLFYAFLMEWIWIMVGLTENT